MVENIWEKWIPNIGVKRKYYIHSIVDNFNGLYVFLFDTDDSSKINVQFPGRVYAYRSVEELAALSYLESVNDKNGNWMASEWTFFVVQNSSYAREVAKNSYDVYSFDSLIHIAIISGESLFEIITDMLPEVEEGWTVEEIETT
jgi:hypothetical protein